MSARSADDSSRLFVLEAFLHSQNIFVSHPFVMDVIHEAFYKMAAESPYSAILDGAFEIGYLLLQRIKGYPVILDADIQHAVLKPYGDFDPVCRFVSVSIGYDIRENFLQGKVYLKDPFFRHPEGLA